MTATEKLPNLLDLLSSAAAYDSVARWTLFFPINLLTSNLEIDLTLEGSGVEEVSEDLAFQESL